MKGGGNLDDRKIIQSYLNGNLYNGDILIEKYKNLLYNLCNKLTKETNEADDLFQDTWVKIFKNIEKYDLSKSFETWVYTICVNLYKDKYNKKKRWLNVIKDYLSNDEKDREWNTLGDNSSLPDETYIKEEENNHLKDKINTLDDTYRIPLMLYYFKESSYQEISDILGIPTGTVKSRLNYAKKKLKNMLEEELYEG